MLSTAARQLHQGLSRVLAASSPLSFLPTSCPTPLSLATLRTVAGCRAEWSAHPRLALNQSIVGEDWGERSAALLDKINAEIESGETGRLFTVVFLRGKQHKITSGQNYSQVCEKKFWYCTPEIDWLYINIP
jgi:hypothetical protein